MTIEEIREQLNVPVPPALVERSPQGFDYIPAAVAMSIANRIFGPGGWSTSIIETSCEQWGDATAYVVTVNVAVHGLGVHRQDVGVGMAQKQRNGEGPAAGAYETARKGAVSDAIKRALHGFGPALGLNLYAGDVMGAVNGEPSPQNDGRPSFLEDEPSPVPRASGKDGRNERIALIKELDQQAERLGLTVADVYQVSVKHYNGKTPQTVALSTLRTWVDEWTKLEEP